MTKIQNYILGLDVGVNSVGWAVVECSINTTKDSKTYMPIRLIDLNSRIFQEMVEAKTGVPKNQKRRTMRGMRRRASRLKGRRQALIAYLQKRKLLPKEIDERFFNEVAHNFAKRIAKQSKVKKWGLPLASLMSPMLMRAYALDDKLEADEFSCALLQLQKRRGYKSNRGAKYDALYEHILGDERKIQRADELEDEEADDDKEEEEEERKVLGGIKALKKDIEERQLRTIAEYVLQRAIEDKGYLKRITGYEVGDEKNNEVSLYAERALYKDEFEEIWKAQAAHLGLTKKDKENIAEIIFYQRPLINPPPNNKRWRHLKYNDVGVCSFFPRRKRAAKALLESQDYRTWQVISNIRMGNDKNLSLEQKKALADHLKNPDNLNARDRLSWKAVKKLLGGETNYRASGDDDDSSNAGICGNRTEIAIVKILGDKWSDYDEKEREELVDLLLKQGDKVELYEELIGKKWRFRKGQEGEAFQLAHLELEPSYMKHCQHVIKNVLKRMQTKGEDYYEACDGLGYHSEVEKPEQGELRPEDVPIIANPRVQKGLYEIRKVVNAVIAKYGKPAVIRLELARDLKASKRHRRLIEWRQEQNRKLNEEADKEMSKVMAAERKFSNLTETRQGMYYLSATERKKYKMWKEQKHHCLYCGNSISKNDLLDSAETEHIIPQSSFHQNYMNTVLACRTCNQDKGDRTPYQAWGTTDRWGQIEKRLKTEGENRKEKCIKYPELPMPKVRRILSKKPPEDNEEGFVESQLNDTRYIAVTAKNILTKLGIRVGITKGGAAALLRDLWGLDGVLPRDPNETIFYDKINTITGEMIAEREKTTIKEFENIKKSIKKDEIVKTSYDATESGQVKNRMDHRHHAIDAFLAAMTDNGVLIKLTRLNRMMIKHRRIKGFKKYQDEADKLENEIKNLKAKIRRPENWQGSSPMAQDLKDILIDKKVVSHQRKAKIWGALHEETVYGQASYITKLKIDTRPPTIRRLAKYLLNDETVQGQGDEAIWILKQSEREAIRTWVEQQEQLEAKERSLPLLNGRVLSSIFLAHRCYVISKEIKDVLRLSTGSWEEGKGTWIKDKQIHHQLHQWLKTHKESELKENPPRMKSPNGPGNIIKSVRVARCFGEDSIASIGENRIYQLGSNHHMEVFINDKKEKKYRVASMKEAAERKSQKQSVINKTPSQEWGNGWAFHMSLAINDIVLWNKDDNRAQALSELGLPIFRVQTMDSNGIIYFRHHSTALTSTRERHALIQARPNTLDCQKISVDTLGDYKQS